MTVDEAQLLDAIAAKLDTIAGLKVYAPGATSASYSMPEDLPAVGASVIVRDAGFGDHSPGSWRRFTYTVPVDLYHNRANLTLAYRNLATAKEAIRALFDRGVTLAGGVSELLLDSISSAADEEVNGKPYLVCAISLSARVARPDSPTA